MTRLGLDRIAPLTVRVSHPVADGAEAVHHGLAVSQDFLEDLFLVLCRGKVHHRSAKLHSFGKSASPGYGLPLSSRTCLHTVSNSVFAADLCGSSYK